MRKLHTDEGLSLRKIASITGWSKSTIDRDLKESPFATMLSHVGQLRSKAAGAEHEAAREMFSGLADGLGEVFGWTDDQWKRGNWPPANDEELLGFKLMLFSLGETLRWFAAVVEAKRNDGEIPPEPADMFEWWEKDAGYRQRLVDRAREDGMLDRIRAHLSQMGHSDKRESVSERA